MPREARIVNTVTIRRTPDEVFAFAATPKSWPQWHPTAISVSGSVDRPVVAGDHVLEYDRFSFLPGRIEWQVRDAKRGQGWSIDGAIRGVPFAGTATTSIEYDLREHAAGTILRRSMTYSASGRIFGLLDALYLKRHNERQSQRAVQQLKRLLEG